MTTVADQVQALETQLAAALAELATAREDIVTMKNALASAQEIGRRWRRVTSGLSQNAARDLQLALAATHYAVRVGEETSPYCGYDRNRYVEVAE